MIEDTNVQTVKSTGSKRGRKPNSAKIQKPVETETPIMNEPVEDIEKVAPEVAPTVPTKPQAKKSFNNEDPIPCRSITAGTLLMEGQRTHYPYKWVDCGDIVEVEYQDLVAEVRSNNSNYIKKPYFIIEDNDFIDAFPQVRDIYDSMYSISDLKEIIRLEVSQMADVINKLPVGAKESIKNIASTMISNGQLDSIKKIKTLDEIFETNFVLMTELFDK